MPLSAGHFCPLFKAFHTVRSVTGGRQSLPHRQVLPVFLCCRQALAFQKIQQNRGSAIGPSLASGFPSKNFFADRHRKICVQASASSQTNSPANIPIPQAKPDANKADAASPFALLMQATARDAARLDKKDTKEAGGKSVDDKSPAGKSDAKQKDAGQTDSKQDDGNRDAAPVQTASQAGAPAKTEKQDKDQDKDKDAAETDKDAAGDLQLAIVQQQTPDQPPPAPMPVAQALSSVPADMDAGTGAQEDIAIDAAAAKAAAPALNTDVPPADPAAAETQTDTEVQPQIAAQTGETDDTAQTIAAQPAATLAAPVDGKPPVTAETVKPAAVKAAAKTADAAKPDELAKAEPAQAAETGDETVQPVQAKPAKSDIAKEEGAASPKAHAAHEAANSRSDAGVSDGQKADAPQANARVAETDSAAPLPKPVPQSATQSNALFAINNIAAPQAAQHAQAPTATQHVQVTAQAQPNLPALAVEISAKSQSGAKQFDIRLDPPELGRVEVRLSIDATGKASAHLSADQPQTLNLLQKDAPVLARALREAGLDVSQDGLNFSLRQQANNQNGNDGNNGRFGSARNFTLSAAAGVDPAAASFAYRAPADGRVDIRV